MKRTIGKWIVPVILAAVILCLAFTGETDEQIPQLSLTEIPEFSGEPYVSLNGNVPQFSADELTARSYEQYSQLDSLGRCGVAMACIGPDLMPTEERGSIGQIKPSGWQTVKYDIVDGKYLFNRCHLIGFQLTGENANVCNLITGTRYLNIEGMLPFENMVADYIKETGNHVLYRVTPCFYEEEFVARGVQIEAMSVEDSGRGISFHVYAYNNQPGVQIDYATGESILMETQSDSGETAAVSYILNTNSKKFHLLECALAQDIKETNRQEHAGNRQELLDRGYTPCGGCNP